MQNEAETLKEKISSQKSKIEKLKQKSSESEKQFNEVTQ